MVAINDYSQLGGIWKDVWGTTVLDPFRFLTPVLNDLPMEEAASAGGIYHQPAMLTHEGGITHAAPRTTPGYGGIPFIGPRAGAVPDWKIEGAQMLGRSQISYEALMRSLSDVSGDAESIKKAVKSATKVVVNSLGRAMAKRAEVLALNGGLLEGLGTIEAVGTTPIATAYESSSNNGYYNDVSISNDTWAQAIFSMAEGSSFDVYSSARTKYNLTANSVLSSPQTGLILISVNPSGSLVSPVTATGRVLRFFHTSNAAYSAGTAGGCSATVLAAGNSIFYEGDAPAATSGATNVSPFGLSHMAKIGSPSYASILHGLDSNTYSMVAGNVVTGVGNVKMAQLMEYLAAPIDYGVVGMKVRALVPTRLFQQLAADEASLRRYSGAPKKADNGSNSIEYFMGGNNVLEVLGHSYQKGGRITCYVPDETHRIGPQDISFLSRSSKGEYTLEAPTGAASEVRALGQYNLYVDCPRHLLTLEGVTY
jgi:hypothetical protein